MFLDFDSAKVGEAPDAVSLESRTAWADRVATRLESQAATLSRPRQRDMVAARTGFEELRGVCAGNASLRPYLHRGREALQALTQARRADCAATIACRDARAAAAARKVEAQLQSETHRRRIVRIVAAAALAEQPSRFTPQVRQCAMLWRTSGPSGRAQQALCGAYRTAVADFWDAVRHEHATARRLAAARDAVGSRRRLREFAGVFTASAWGK